VAKAYPFKRELESKPVPAFTPAAGTHTRNGLVISF
jgi:hypothetical protein